MIRYDPARKEDKKTIVYEEVGTLTRKQSLLKVALKALSFIRFDCVAKVILNRMSHRNVAVLYSCMEKEKIHYLFQDRIVRNIQGPDKETYIPLGTGKEAGIAEKILKTEGNRQILYTFLPGGAIRTTFIPMHLCQDWVCGLGLLNLEGLDSSTVKKLKELQKAFAHKLDKGLDSCEMINKDELLPEEETGVSDQGFIDGVKDGQGEAPTIAIDSDDQEFKQRIESINNKIEKLNYSTALDLLLELTKEKEVMNSELKKSDTVELSLTERFKSASFVTTRRNLTREYLLFVPEVKLHDPALQPLEKGFKAFENYKRLVIALIREDKQISKQAAVIGEFVKWSNDSCQQLEENINGACVISGSIEEKMIEAYKAMVQTPDHLKARVESVANSLLSALEEEKLKINKELLSIQRKSRGWIVDRQVVRKNQLKINYLQNRMTPEVLSYHENFRSLGDFGKLQTLINETSKKLSDRLKDEMGLNLDSGNAALRRQSLKTKLKNKKLGRSFTQTYFSTPSNGLKSPPPTI